MNKRAKVALWILSIVVVLLAGLLYRTERKLHDFADDVNFRSQMFLFTSQSMQWHIDELDSIKMDTGDRQQNRYEFVKDDFQRQNLFTMFAMATSMNDIGENQDTLNALVQEYEMALDPIETFYVWNDSAKDFTANDIEKLQQDYHRLQAVSKKFEDMRLNIW